MIMSDVDFGTFYQFPLFEPRTLPYKCRATCITLAMSESGRRRRRRFYLENLASLKIKYPQVKLKKQNR